MHDRYGITEDYLVKEAASVLKGLLKAYPEYRTTPFFRKLVRVLSALDNSSLVGWWWWWSWWWWSWWHFISPQRTHTRFIFLFVWPWALLEGRFYRHEEPLGQAQHVATKGERGGPRTRFRFSRTPTFTSSCSSAA
jgi:hypothetical protein